MDAQLREFSSSAHIFVDGAPVPITVHFGLYINPMFEDDDPRVHWHAGEAICMFLLQEQIDNIIAERG